MSDLDHHHQTTRLAKKALIILAGSALAIPLVVGLATHSYLLAVVAFSVWTSAFSVLLGLIVSSRTANAPTHPSPLTPYPSVGGRQKAVQQPGDHGPDIDAWLVYRDEEGTKPRPGSHLPNGWLLPMHVTLRRKPPPDVAFAAGKAVIRTAWLALGLAVLAAGLAYSGGTSSVPAVVTGLLASLTAAYDLAILLFTRHSVRCGAPRPSLDRPSSLIGAFIPFGLTMVYSVTGVFKGLGSWNAQVAIGFLILIASFGANIWWFIKSSQRWNLTYEVVHA